MPKFNWTGALLVGIILSSACGANSTPTTPIQAATVPSSPPASTVSFQALPLDQPVDVTLNAKLADGPNCEIGEDPVPCVRFTIDAPRAGTLRVQMQFPAPQPMFMYLYRRTPDVLGNVADLQNVASDQSPLLAQPLVEAGRVYLHAGLNIPWANTNQPMHFQLLATLQ
jgi:hypothetical protein